MSTIHLRSVTLSGLGDAAAFLWDMMLESHPEESISHREMPSMREHLAFVGSHPYRAWYIIEAEDGAWVGHVSLTYRNEIGIRIARAYRRRGYARQAIGTLRALHEPLPAQPSERPGCYVANINPENAASIALFKSLGATLLQVTYQLPGD